VLKISIEVFDRDFPKPFDMGRSIGVVEASSTPSYHARRHLYGVPGRRFLKMACHPQIISKLWPARFLIYQTNEINMGKRNKESALFSKRA
jgi:hypothetical protein